MNKIILRDIFPALLCLAGILCASNNSAWGQTQPLQVRVIITQPAPTTLEQIMAFEGDVLVTVLNQSQQAQEFKLIPELTGDNGLHIAVKPSYIPSTPINVGPGQMLNFRFRDLKFYNAGLTDADLIFEGYSYQEMIRSEALPEGFYTLCVTAFDYTTNEQLSSNFGCGNWNLRQFDPPILVNPYNEQVVEPVNPQQVIFNWTPSGIPGRTRYRFELVDLDDYALNNPNDAFTNPTIAFPFVEENLPTPNLVYDLSKPPLIVGHKYAYRVQAYDPTGQLIFRNDGYSEVFGWDYKKKPSLTAPTDNDPDIDFPIITGIIPNDPNIPDGPGSFNTPQPGPQIVSACTPPAEPGNTAPYSSSLTPGMSIGLGHFTLVLGNTNGSTPLTGEGFIQIPWLNAQIKVNFSNLDVNTDLEAYEGDDIVYADDDSGLIPASLLSDFDQLVQNAGVTEDLAQQLYNYTDDPSRIANLLDPEDELGLPVGIQTNDLMVILTGIEFSISGARLNAIMNINLPEATGNRSIVLGVKGACFADDGVGTASALELLNDQAITISNIFSMQIDNGTELTWDGAGIENLHLMGSLEFDNSAITDENGTDFSIAFDINTQNFMDWSAEVTPSSNMLKMVGLEDLRFEFDGPIVYDHSSVNNNTGFDMHSGHPLNGPGILSWLGLHFNSINVHLPPGLDADIAIQDLILDETGIWAEVDVNFGEGVLNLENLGWDASITGFNLDIEANAMQGAGISGSLKLPISQIDEIAFTAPLLNGEGFQFNVELGEEISMEMWMAQLSFSGNSVVGINQVGNTYVPSAELHGLLSIEWNSENKPENCGLNNFNMPDVAFSDFIITVNGGQPSIESITMEFEGYESDQSSFATFPLYLSQAPSLEVMGVNVGLTLGLGLKLDNLANGLNGSTAFTINGKLQNGYFGFHNLQLNSVSISSNLGVIDIQEATLELFQDDPTYGNGFRASLDVVITPVDLGIEMTLQVGKTTQNNPFRYFYFDAMVEWGGIGINIPNTPISFYGFGGGLYYNMTRQAMAELSPGEFDGEPFDVEDPSNSPTGVVFTPQENTFGFQATVVFGLSGAKAAFNADLTLGMEMSTQLGITQVWMEGNGYVMVDFSPEGGRGDAFIDGSTSITINFVDDVFSGISTMNVDLLGIVTASGTIDFMFSKTEWYFNFGSWDENMDPASYDPAEDGQRIQISVQVPQVELLSLKFTSYLMMGNAISPSLPPMHYLVQQQFPGATQNNTLLNNAKGGLGFAFGASTDFELDLEFLIFFAYVKFVLGGDVLVKNYATAQCEDEFGFNSWYARGQAYAYLHVAGGAQIKIFGVKKRVTIAELIAAAMIKVETPKPTWVQGNFRFHGSVLNGLIEFDTQFRFESGEKLSCSLGGGTPFDDIPIVSHTDPDIGDENVYVYTSPNVAFNFPNEPFYIDEQDEEDPSETNRRWFRYGILNFEVKYDPQEQGLPNGVFTKYTGPVYKNDGRSCAYNITDALPPESDITLTIRTQGYEIINFESQPVGGHQEYISTFETGPYPDFIDIDNIVSSIPVNRQRYYTKDDFNQGEINLSVFSQGHLNHVFRTNVLPDDGFDIGGHYSYKMEFKDLLTNSKVRRDLQLTQDNITYNLPADWMQNSRVYRMDIIRIYHPPAINVQTNTIDNMANVDISGYTGGGGIDDFVWALEPQGTTLPLIIGQTELAQSQGGSQGGPIPVNMNLQSGGGGGGGGNGGGGMQPGGLGELAGNPAPDPTFIRVLDRRVKENETMQEQIAKSILSHSIYYKTSKFNTKAQKLANIQVVNTGSNGPSKSFPIKKDDYYQNLYGNNNAESVGVELPLIVFDCEEPLDVIDALYRKYYDFTGGNNHKLIPPLYEFRPDPYDSDWREEFYSDDFWGNIKDPGKGLFFQLDWDDYADMMHDYINFHSIPDVTETDFPVPNWDSFTATPFDGNIWDDDRHASGWDAAYFGKIKGFGQKYAGPTGPFDQALMRFYDQKEFPSAGLEAWGVDNFSPLLQAGEVNDHPDVEEEEEDDGLQISQTLTTNTGGGGSPGFMPDLDLSAGDQYAGPAKHAAIDFTDWVAMKDYFLYRKKVIEYLDEYDACAIHAPGLLDPEDQNFCYEYYWQLVFWLSHEDWLPFYSRNSGHWDIYIDDTSFEYETQRFNY